MVVIILSMANNFDRRLAIRKQIQRYNENLTVSDSEHTWEAGRSQKFSWFHTYEIPSPLWLLFSHKALVSYRNEERCVAWTTGQLTEGNSKSSRHPSVIKSRRVPQDSIQDPWRIYMGSVVHFRFWESLVNVNTIFYIFSVSVLEPNSFSKLMIMLCLITTLSYSHYKTNTVQSPQITLWGGKWMHLFTDAVWSAGSGFKSMIFLHLCSWFTHTLWWDLCIQDTLLVYWGAILGNWTWNII